MASTVHVLLVASAACIGQPVWMQADGAPPIDTALRAVTGELSESGIQSRKMVLEQRRAGRRAVLSD